MSPAATGSFQHIKGLLGFQNGATTLLIMELPTVTW